MSALHVCWITLTSFSGTYHNRTTVKVNDITAMEDQETQHCAKPNRTMVLFRDGKSYVCVEEFLVEIEQKIKETCK